MATTVVEPTPVEARRAAIENEAHLPASPGKPRGRRSEEEKRSKAGQKKPVETVLEGEEEQQRKQQKSGGGERKEGARQVEAGKAQAAKQHAATTKVEEGQEAVKAAVASE
ncbi:uncharacterized protein A4U43_C04F20470 [Asparagus officinalis]|uniref:Uncharacterized protein n=1 Tax=Asparagus officinalis TaxID=4686 RepID=A0A5P1F7R5_ASPOF|nr:uncharacterized protein A4U43_C04F20470 [Asparagus officinalis]